MTSRFTASATARSGPRCRRRDLHCPDQSCRRRLAPRVAGIGCVPGFWGFPGQCKAARDLASRTAFNKWRLMAIVDNVGDVIAAITKRFRHETIRAFLQLRAKAQNDDDGEESADPDVRRAQPEDHGLCRQSTSSRRRTSTRWRAAARASRPPTRRARSAFRRAPPSPSASTCTRSATGTTPMPTTARSRAGTTGCAIAATRSCRSASCTFAARRATITASREEIVPMHIVDGIGDVKGLVRRRHPGAQGRRQDGEARRPRRVAVHGLRPRHRVARADLAARGSAEGSTTSRGCCSCRSSRRTSR